MSKHRPPSKNSKYYLPKETFLTVIHYCKQYPIWIDELKRLPVTGRAIRYDQDRVQASGDYDPTSSIAIRRAEITKKKETVDTVAIMVAGDVMARWLLQGVCDGKTFYELHHDGMPCQKDMYYMLRRRFYYEMSKRI